jgi:heat shock protein HtpX
MFGNWLKTSILMAGIIALFGAIGMMLGGQQGMLLALVLARDELLRLLVLGQDGPAHVQRAGGRCQTAPQFYNMVQELAAPACRCRAST